MGKKWLDPLRSPIRTGSRQTVLTVIVLFVLGPGSLPFWWSKVIGTEGARQDTEKLAKSLPERVDDLESASPPVGTVMAFAGARLADERGGGWLLCDGRTFAGLVATGGIRAESLERLKTVLGADRLPDYRGFFLRGVGGTADRNPDASRRTHPLDPSKEIGDLIGSVQKDATRRPNVPFTTNDPGNHTHTAPTNNGQGGPFEVPPQLSGADFIRGAETSPGGHHTHTVVAGGDNETRPHNVAVHWIIKYR